MEDFSVLVGKTMSSVENWNDEEITFTTTSGEKFKLWHHQDCCENVYVEDVVGDLRWLGTSNGYYSEEVDFDRVGVA